MRREIKLIHSDGSEEWLTHLSSEEEREIGLKDICSLYVPRTEVTQQDIDEGHDVAELRLGGEAIFSGPIEDVVRQGDRRELIVESPERYGERAEPTGKVDEYANVSDAEIIRDAIHGVPELEVGSVEATNGAMSILYQQASPALKARKAELNSPGVLRFNPDRTVDYGRLGRNKSHETLSPRKQNVATEFEIDRKSSYDQVTHLRLLGSGEGQHQIQVDVVADDYEEGQPQIWKTYTDKSISDEETARRRAKHYVEELKTQKIDVELTVKGLEINPADLFRVYIPEDDVNEVLEVVKSTRIIDKEGVRYDLTLSNHRDTREDPEEKNRADLTNYNTAIEGNSVPINTSGGRQPVGPGNNYELQLYYPSEVEYEHRLNVRVIGLPYRAYSAGAVDNADFEASFTDETGVETHPLDYSTSWTNLVTATIPSTLDTSVLYAMQNFRLSGLGTSDEDATVEFRYVRDGGQEVIPDTGGYRYTVGENDSNFVQFIDPTNVSGSRIDIQTRLVRGPSSSNIEMDVSHTFSAAGRHTHDPDPGIIEGFGKDGRTKYYPQNCQVIVNNSPIGAVLEGRDSRWSGSVDIRGELNPGEVNTIEVTSDSLGHMQGYVEGDLYRRIRGRGGETNV